MIIFSVQIKIFKASLPIHNPPVTHMATPLIMHNFKA